MATSLRTFLQDLKEKAPNDFVTIEKEVNPANYDVTAIIKHLQDMKKFPVLLFNKPLNLEKKVNHFRFLINVFTTQKMIDLALNMPAGGDRMALVEEFLKREDKRVKPVIVEQDKAPVKEVICTGDRVNLKGLPIMRHYEMDGGPYIVMASIVRDRESGVYNASYHRMEVKDKNFTALYSSPRHLWKVFRDYEERGEECPVVTVIGHHPNFYLGACYKGPFAVDEYDIIGGYLQEPLRLVPSETWGKDFLVPADAEIIIEGALLPGERVVEGPFGEAPGYVGGQRYEGSVHNDVRAITYRKDAIYQCLLTPDEDKPWMDLARDGAYYRRIKEAVPTVKAVCKGGRYAHYNIFISLKKMAEGDQGRAAAAALTFDHSKNIFLFDEDIDVFNPTEILWALATRVQPHRDISIIKPCMRGNKLDPSVEDIETSAMIVDATRPYGITYVPASKCPDEAKARIKLEDYVPEETLNQIPVDRTSYWG